MHARELFAGLVMSSRLRQGSVVRGHETRCLRPMNLWIKDPDVHAMSFRQLRAAVKSKEGHPDASSGPGSPASRCSRPIAVVGLTILTVKAAVFGGFAVLTRGTWNVDPGAAARPAATAPVPPGRGNGGGGVARTLR